MQFDDKEIMEQILAEAKSVSDELYNSIVKSMNIARGSGHNAQMAKYLISQLLASAKMDIVEEQFYYIVQCCNGVHGAYATELEEFKQAMWGRFMEFSTVVDSKINQYTALYKTAMALKKDYINLCNDHIKYATMVLKYSPKGNLLDNKYQIPSDIKVDRESYKAFADETKTNGAAIKRDREEHDKSIAQMEVALAKTRANLRSDVEATTIAKQAVHESEKDNYSDRA